MNSFTLVFNRKSSIEVSMGARELYIQFSVL